MSQGLSKALEIKHCMAQGLCPHKTFQREEKKVPWWMPVTTLKKDAQGRGIQEWVLGTGLTFEQMPKREPCRLRRPGTTAGT